MSVLAGPAQPVVTSSEAPDGGPARPVAVVSAPLVTRGGPALKVVEVSDNRPRLGGPAMPVVVASGIQASAPVAGPPIPVYVVSGSLVTDPDLSNPSFVAQNTTFTNDMGPDGFSWPQAGPYGPLMVDAFGKLICLSEDSGGNHTITWSNDSGATWQDGPSIGFITRGSGAYNTIDDKLHVLWLAQAATDGILQRTYAPTRDGSNNITGWTIEGAGYVQFDAETTGTMQYEHPAILWLSDQGAHGTLLCVWCARNTGAGGTGNEIRAVRRALSNTAADRTLSNWVHLGIASATTIGNAPGTGSYTALLANATTGVPHVATLRLANGDLFVGYHDGTVTAGKMAGLFAYRVAEWDGANWAALTAAATISNLVRAGTNSGSAQLGELLSKPREVATNVVALGIATWKSNVLGDTWGFAHIVIGGAITLVDSYSANGAHSYAPAGDIDYDSAADRIIVSYITTTDQDAYVALYDDTTADEAPLLVFDTEPVDIPLLHTRALVGKLCMLFRDTSAPFRGWFGTLDWNL